MVQLHVAQEISEFATQLKDTGRRQGHIFDNAWLEVDALECSLTDQDQLTLLRSIGDCFPKVDDYQVEN